MTVVSNTNKLLIAAMNASLQSRDLERHVFYLNGFGAACRALSREEIDLLWEHMLRIEAFLSEMKREIHTGSEVGGPLS